MCGWRARGDARTALAALEAKWRSPRPGRAPKLRYRRYRGTVGTAVPTVPTVPTVLSLVPRENVNIGRERNPLALPTLDMYLPLSKFESIQRVSLTLP